MTELTVHESTSHRDGRRWPLIAQVCLTVACLGLFIRILDEPFLAITKTDAWTLIALPAFLACFQFLVAMFVTYRLVRYREKRVQSAALLAWSLIGLWLLLFVPKAYIDDIVKFTVQLTAYSCRDR